MNNSFKIKTRRSKNYVKDFIWNKDLFLLLSSAELLQTQNFNKI